MKSKLLLPIFLLALFGTTLANGQVDLSPGVARISLIHGDVSTQRGDTGDWAAAALNQPMVAGDRVSTGDRSRAEVQLDHANILRLGNSSQANISTLTRRNIQVQVGQGLISYTVFKDSEAEIEIDTPNVAVRPASREGVYRIEVNGEETQVIVRKGAADISTPQGSTRVEKGQSAIVHRTGGDAEYKLAGAPSKDSWDSWNSERDGVIRNAQSWGRTNRYYVGAEDLDAYGRWVNVPDYGYVWSPVVAVGWAPYRAGRWIWEPYWGWTWVSYEPWGWAPYHYGRWFLYGGSWMWWPGPVYARYRPIWAPAYVSFFGFGGHRGVSVGFGLGSVGWLPIGPGDRFFPWWGGYRSRFNVVNVTNITNIRHSGGWIAPLHHGPGFSNLRLAAANNEMVRQAISTVPANHFGTGRSAPTPVSREAFRDGHMLTGNVPIVPTREMVSASNHPASASTLRGGQELRFFTKSGPGAAPESFDRQAAHVQDAIQHSGRFGAQEAQNRQPDNPAKPAARPPASAVGQPRADSQQRDKAPANSAEHSGWRKFSDANSGQSGSRAASSAQNNESRNSRRPEVTNDRQAQNSRPGNRSEGWQKFTPQPNAATRETPSRGSQMSAPGNRGVAGPEARTPQSYSRAERTPGDRDTTRPRLDLRQPIVTPRPDRGATRSNEGGSNRGGGGRSEPRSSGASRGGGGQSHSSSGRSR